MLVTILISLGILVLIFRKNNMLSILNREDAVYIASGLFILSAILIFIANCTTYNRVPINIKLYNNEFKVVDYDKSSGGRYRISLANGQDMIILKDKFHVMSNGDETSIEIHGYSNYYDHDTISAIVYSMIYLSIPEIQQSNVYSDVYWVDPSNKK